MSGIIDGFGDDLSASEAVQRYERWSHAVAGGMVGHGHPMHDDLVQEGLIKIWQVLEAKGGKANVSATYLTQAAHYRMVAIVSGRPMVGGDSTPGPKSRPTMALVDWDDVQSGDREIDPSLIELLWAADLIDAVEWSYHHGQIMEVLSSLPERDREYVVRRFWGQSTDTEIARDIGVTNKALHTRWRRQIIPAIKQRLAALNT